MIGKKTQPGEGLPLLPELIRSKGYSLPGFAKELGTTYVTLYRWIVGMFSPNLRQLRAMATILNVTITDIVGM